MKPTEPQAFPPSSLETREIIRDEVVSKLRVAIDFAERLAIESGEEPAGSGGIPPKVRYYTLMAYLSQTLELFLKDQNSNEVTNRLRHLEKRIVAFEADKARSQTG